MTPEQELELMKEQNRIKSEEIERLQDRIIKAQDLNIAILKQKSDIQDRYTALLSQCNQGTPAVPQKKTFSENVISNSQTFTYKMGKYKGMLLGEVLKEDAGYVNWLKEQYQLYIDMVDYLATGE